MKTSSHLIVFLVVIIYSITVTKAQAQKPYETPVTIQTLGDPSAQIFNVNRISSWFRSNGNGNFPPFGTGNGMVFPRGTASVIYEDGIMWGGKVFRDASKTMPAPFGQPYRVGGNEYVQGNQPGPILGFGSNAVASNPSDPVVRICRIRRDWNVMSDDELRKDAAEYNGYSNVTSVQIQTLKDQYSKDWAEWPVLYGAPYVERNGITGYQPPPGFNYNPNAGPLFTAESLVTQKRDEPGISGANPTMPADQVLWTVYNDLNRSLTTALYGSEPIGLEVQVTLWGYKRDDPLGNVVFKRVRFINKGGVDTSGTGQNGAFWIDSMYVAQWSDPDVGSPFDDLIGCDTLLSLGFAYNFNNNDAEYNFFSLPPPAVGYDFFAGPSVPASPSDSAIFDLRYVRGKKNLGMTSFAYFSAGSTISDPRPRNWASGTTLWYKMLRGFAPIVGTDVYYPFPPGEIPNKFPLSGDPVGGTGLFDGLGTNYSFTAGDRRIILNTGPFSLAPGDTQEIVVALLAGMGADRLSSISELKAIDNYAQAMYNSLFTLPEAPVFSAEVGYPSGNTATVTVKAFDTKRNARTVATALKQRNGIDASSIPLYDDGVHNDGLADDGVFGGYATINRRQDALYLSGSVMFKNDLSAPLHRIADNITTAGRVTLANPTIFFDNVNNDSIASPDELIHFGFTVQNATAFGFFNVNIKPSVGGSILIPQLSAGSQPALTYNPGDANTFVRFQIPSQYSDTVMRIGVVITDSMYNRWTDTLAIPVVRITPKQNFWQQTTGPYGGDVRAITVDTSGFLYLVTYPTGVYKSTNVGETWSKLAGYDQSYPTGITLAADASLILISSLDAWGNGGASRSTDGGKSWNTIYGIGSPRFVAVSPVGHIYVGSYDILARSTNNGTIWETRSDPIDPLYYPGMQSIAFNVSSHIILGTSRGVYRSTDGGLTWTSLGLQNKSVLAVQVQSNGTIFAGTDTSFYKSTNDGGTWQQIDLGGVLSSVPSLLIDSSGTVYAGTASAGIFQSTDVGVTWTQLGSGVQGKVQWLTKDKVGRFFAGTSHALFRSTNNGQSWEEKASGISAVTCYGFASTSGAEIYAATHRGILRSSDYGSSWNLVYSSSANTPRAIVGKSNGVVFAGMASGMVKSTDNGITWNSSGLTGIDVRALAVSQSGDILAGTSDAGRIYRTANEGASWTVLRTGSYSTEQIVALATEADLYISAAIVAGTVILSTDNGSTWITSSQYLSVRALYNGSDGALYAGTFGGIFRSTDHGFSWTWLGGRGFASQNTGSTFAVTTNKSGYLFAGQMAGLQEDRGVYRSTDQGITWFKINSGLGFSNGSGVYSLTVTSNDYLLVGTYGEGIYRTIATTTSVDEAKATQVPTEFVLTQNYPNPFNPRTTIRFAVPHLAKVHLRVYNLLGQEVEVLLSREMRPGVYSVDWNASRFASGVYFYRIEADGFVDTKKMLLLK